MKKRYTIRNICYKRDSCDGCKYEGSNGKCKAMEEYNTTTPPYKWELPAEIEKERCEHRNASKIHTYEGAEMKIIDTKYQCTGCGEIMTREEYQDILTNHCSNCGGTGKYIVGHHEYKCGCILDEE